MSVQTIGPARLDELCRSGAVELIDVRTPAEFREVHVAAARNIPLDRLDPAVVLASRNGSKDAPIYLICHAGSRGRQACEKFLAAGFASVANVEGGTSACVAAGLPVVRGKKTISLERQVRIIAGSLTVLGSLLAWLVHPWFLVVPTVMGAGLAHAGLTDSCLMGQFLARMPWNQAGDAEPACAVAETASVA
jgi:rhodanese-related sulfurtransferase